MKKINKLNIKKSIVMLGIATTALTTASCGNNADKKEVKEQKIEKDKHVMMSIGDQIIIFKNCDETYDIDFMIYPQSGSGSIEILEEGTNKRINTYSSSNYFSYDGNDPAMIEMENKVIEEGAIVYTKKPKVLHK